VGLEGEQIGVVVASAAAGLLVLVPFLDGRSSRGEKSPLFTAVALFGLAYLLVFTLLGHYAD
jgi:quinol-cytochrome oxidoreductase complex cytochrome b subunit